MVRLSHKFVQAMQEIVELSMDETSSLYAEPSEEVGYNKPSALVTGIDPEVKVVYDILN